MSHRARQLAQHADARQMRDISPLPVGFGLCLLAVRDIDKDARQRRGSLVGAVLGAAAGGDPAKFAVGPDDAVLDIELLPELDPLLDRLAQHRTVVGMHAIEEGAQIARLFTGQAENDLAMRGRPHFVVADIPAPEADIGR